MKSKFIHRTSLILFQLLVTLILTAQVGINRNNPQQALHIGNASSGAETIRIEDAKNGGKLRGANFSNGDANVIVDSLGILRLQPKDKIISSSYASDASVGVNVIKEMINWTNVPGFKETVNVGGADGDMIVHAHAFTFNESTGPAGAASNRVIRGQFRLIMDGIVVGKGGLATVCPAPPIQSMAVVNGTSNAILNSEHLHLTQIFKNVPAGSHIIELQVRAFASSDAVALRVGQKMPNGEPFDSIGGMTIDLRYK